MKIGDLPTEFWRIHCNAMSDNDMELIWTWWFGDTQTEELEDEG